MLRLCLTTETAYSWRRARVVLDKPQTRAVIVSDRLMAFSSDPSSPALRLLIVEDNVDSAEILSLLLQREGFEVRTALDAQEALSVIDEFLPDVAILDLGLPGITGYELVAKLKTSPGLESCRFVALTGYSR